MKNVQQMLYNETGEQRTGVGWFPVQTTVLTAKRSDPPLVCIEITGPPSRSPSQSTEEMVDKTAVYFRFGVKSCWIVVPAVKGVFVYDRPGHYQFFRHDETLRDSNLGLELALSAVFD